MVADEDAAPRLGQALGVYPFGRDSELPHQGFEEVHTIKVPIAVEDIIDLPLMDDALEEAQDEWGEALTRLLLQHLPDMDSQGMVLRGVLGLLGQWLHRDRISCQRAGGCSARSWRYGSQRRPSSCARG